MNNRISGRVVLAESGEGIPDLLVVVYDIDPATEPEELLDDSADHISQPGDRLGSVLTTADGSFALEYDDGAFRIRNQDEQRPDIRVMLLAAERPGSTPEASPIYVTQVVRQNAGRNEEFLIRLEADLLRKHGITGATPASHQETADVASRIAERSKDTAAIVEASIAGSRIVLDAHRERFAAQGESLKSSLRSRMAAVPVDALHRERFVDRGESPAEKSLATVRDGIGSMINSTDRKVRAPRRGFISLSSDEADRLKSQRDGSGTLPLSAATTENAGALTATELTRSTLATPCIPVTVTDRLCADAPDADDTDRGETPAVVAGDGVTISDEIEGYVARLLQPLTAPEEELVTELTPVATRASLRASVRTLEFRPSPADVASYHDYTNLQVAFAPTWQRAIDESALEIAQDAYETIIELGGDPLRPDLEGMHPIQALEAEGRLTLRAARATTSPTVRDHRGGDATTTGAQGGVVVGDGSIRDHRTDPGGDLGNPDPVERLPALLLALQERMRQKYAFTLFAANETERSVNFGILNTFRQTWTPLSYQAGRLVKSIPLAPKQSQKVVISRKISRKRATKEVENNLRVLKDESSSTNRSEQEITSRAETKTEFGYQNEASVPEVGKSTTSFKLDASKSTSSAKKAIHEAVFKAAQEVRSERTTEVTTEETYAEEYTESTEISNPNDEIAVTFLFYELQRRYRVHEALYGIAPVVLVAQEMPAPHEIDEAWLVANDWILKRAILDDSFLSTLNTLPQSAGAETAITEMRVSIAQQRSIVGSLNRELAAARQDATTQGGMLQGAAIRKSSGGLLQALEGLTLADDVLRAAESALLGPNPGSESNKQALQDSADRAADRVRDLVFRLEREVTALNALLESYTRALQAHHTHLAQIARLRVHIKANILYYMQAIWMHEPPDQRFLRLHNVPIPTFETTSARVKIDFDAPEPSAPTTFPHRTLPRYGAVPPRTVYPVEHVRTLSVEAETVPLSEVANIYDLRGFLGNYMIFVLDESNPLTDFMMSPYLDSATNELLDPSDPMHWSLDEYAEYVCCLRESLTKSEFKEIREQLQEQYEAILTSTKRSNDVLVVPTDSLFIEALPAEHSLIERYKRDHRMIDVKQAQAKVREHELENLRKAARILAGELDDPDVNQRVTVEGQPAGIVVPVPPQP